MNSELERSPEQYNDLAYIQMLINTIAQKDSEADWYKKVRVMDGKAINNLTRDNLELVTNHNTMVNTLDSYKLRLDNASLEISNLARTQKQLENRATTLFVENRDLQDQVRSKNVHLGQTKDRVNKLTEDNGKLQTLYEAQTKRVVDLTQKVEEYETKIKVSLTWTATLKHDLDERYKDLRRLTSKIEDLSKTNEGESAGDNTELVELRSRVAVLEQAFRDQPAVLTRSKRKRLQLS